ncbi:MAG: DUF2284 domain-containing protein, partial [Nitrososphaerales archaeon]
RCRMEIPVNFKRFCELAKDLGALDARIISARDIVINDRTRLKCQYGCPFYNHYLTCPPFSPTIEQSKRLIDGYDWALLFTVRFSSSAPESFFTGRTHSIKNMVILQKIAAELERQLYLAGYDSAFGMACGPCLLCDECVLQPGKCKYPSIARPPSEALGIDVGKTVGKVGYKLKVATSPSDTVDIFGLVLIV